MTTTRETLSTRLREASQQYGSWDCDPWLYEEAADALDTYTKDDLERAAERICRRRFVRFYWKHAGDLGTTPDMERECYEIAIAVFESLGLREA